MESTLHRPEGLINQHKETLMRCADGVMKWCIFSDMELGADFGLSVSAHHHPNAVKNDQKEKIKQEDASALCPSFSLFIFIDSRKTRRAIFLVFCIFG